jgi:Holliday junction resolvasome RuvABC endonuclease subunit
MAKKSNYLYALDISLSCTGLVIFDVTTFKPIVVTSFPTNSKLGTGERLRGLEQEFLKYLKEYIPNEVVIEQGFVKNNIATQKIFNTLGVVLCRLWDYSPTFYAPSHWKKLITGNGAANKERVQEVLRKKYKDIKFKDDNESDAFGLGLTYLIEKYNMPWTIK